MERRTTSPLLPLHTAYLEALIPQLQQDGRFEALLAGGSLVHGGFDEHSDLDLVLVVRPDAYEQVMAQRHAFAARIGNLLSAFTGEHVGEPRLLICLYGPPLLHVDLKFIVPADLAQLVERPLVLWARQEEAMRETLDNAVIQWPGRAPEWFEERIWIWLHYGAVKLARGELFEALAMLAFLREQVLGPLLHRRRGLPQRGVRKLEQSEETAQALRAAVAAHDRESVSRALTNAVNLYLELRSDCPPETVTPGMPELLLPLLTIR